MGRQFRFPPYPKKPHTSGQARIKIRGREHYLGPFDSVESHREYQRLYTFCLTNPPEAIIHLGPPKTDLTLVEVFAEFFAAMKKERGEKWRELEGYKRALAVIDRMCPRVRINEFDVRHLTAVRDAMASGSWLNPTERGVILERKKPIGWCRSYCNQQVVRIRSVVRWAESQGMAPRGSWEHLRTLRRLRPGSPTVRHTPEKRQAVDWERVEKTLPHLRPTVRALVLVLWWAGGRPSEIAAMRVCDLTAVGDALEFRPAHHKTEHLGQDRLIVLGPNALEAIRPCLEKARQRSGVSVVFPAAPRRQPKGRGPYLPITVAGLCRAVQSGCKKAGVAPWTPYQLRHAAKERIAQTEGIEAARTILRHTSLGMTARYASRIDLEFAQRIAKKCG